MVGEFDLSTRDHLADVLECLRLRGCTAVEVDARDVSFVDASTLRVLHEEAVRLRRVDGTLVVVAGSETFARIVGLARYADLVPATAARRTAPSPAIG
jgi:anti-anti-sigma factor